MQARPPLIVDSDPAFIDSLRADPQAANLAPLVAQTSKNAQLLLADLSLGMSGVFVNLALQDGLSVVRFAHQHRPATPIYVFDAASSRFEEHHLKRLPIQEVLRKPITYAALVAKVSPAAALLDVTQAPAPGADPVNSEITAEDSHFIPIRAENFLAGSRSLFDVYVRLVSGRYVKILQAGDGFSPERVSGYLAKGVTHFHIHREEQERYLAYCDQLTDAMLGRHGQAIPLEVKLSQTLNQGEETMNFLKSRGVSETHLQYASSFVSHTKELTQRLEPGKHDMLRGFLSDVAAYEHGVGTSMIAALLIYPLHMEGDRSSQIVGMSALLHDIGLYRMPEALHSENREEMSAEQIALYETHPLEGAKILKTVPRVDPAVIQAVAQHHERRNKKGFPAHIGSGHINRVAEIVGISDDFLHLIERSKRDPSLILLHEMENHVFGGFSQPVVEVFRKIFFSAHP